MRKFFKWLGIILGALVGLVLIVLVGLLVYGQISFKPKLVDRPLYPITADTSPEGLARGKYLLENAMSCTKACHTPKGKQPLSGNFDEIHFGPISGVFAPPNLTPDKETGLGNWTDAQIARAIREGVDKDGVELVIMPAYNYHVLSDKDVAAIIGYLRSLPPVRNQIPPVAFNAAGKAMLALHVFGPPSLGEPISAPQVSPAPGTPEYGAYMLALAACSDCHGKDLAGGRIPFSDASVPAAANITPAGELSVWSEADFIKAVQIGITPSRQLSDEMPHYSMSAEDLAAIFRYLKTIPAVPSK